MLNVILPLLNLVLYDLLFVLKVVFEVLELRHEGHRETLNSVHS
jgi:hypothetical protein